MSEHRVSRNHGVITILLINAALSLAINCLAVTIQMNPNEASKDFPATSHHRARILQLAMFDYRRVYPKIEPHVVKYSIHGACIHMYIYTYVHLYIYIYTYVRVMNHVTDLQYNMLTHPLPVLTLFFEPPWRICAAKVPHQCAPCDLCLSRHERKRIALAAARRLKWS